MGASKGKWCGKSAIPSCTKPGTISGLTATRCRSNWLKQAMKAKCAWRTWYLIAAAVFLSVVTPGCAIHAWRVVPTDSSEEPISSYAQQPGAVIYYNVPTVFEKATGIGTADSLERARSAQHFAELLEKALTKNPTFEKAILTSEAPEHGYYVSVDVTHMPHLSSSDAFKIVLCSVTLILIPCYLEDAVEYRISYQLFKDGKELGAYREMVQQKTLVWNLILLAIPFIADSWAAEAWTFSKEQAFAETSVKFWRDARADGHF